MATLQELNRQAERQREFLQGALAGGSLQVANRDPSTGQVTGFRAGSPFLTQPRTSTRQPTGAPNIPGAGLGTFGVEGPGGLSGPSALLQSSGQISRRFDTSGLNRAGGLRTPSAVAGAGGDNVQISRTDIQSQLDTLLTQIAEAGGTPQAQAASGKRAAAADELLGTVQALTPAAAQAQAQGLVDNITRSVLDEVLPQLQAAGEGAGASRSALDQLQLNDVATRIAERSATVVVEAITGFAGAQAAAGGVVERLTAADPISNELISLITGTPTETQQTSGPVDILKQLGLIPEGVNAGGDTGRFVTSF